MNELFRHNYHPILHGLIVYCGILSITSISKEDNNFAIFSPEAYSNISFVNSSLEGVFHRTWNDYYEGILNHFMGDSISVRNSSFSWMSRGFYGNNGSEKFFRNCKFTDLSSTGLDIRNANTSDSIFV